MSATIRRPTTIDQVDIPACKVVKERSWEPIKVVAPNGERLFFRTAKPFFVARVKPKEELVKSGGSKQRPRGATVINAANPKPFVFSFVPSEELKSFIKEVEAFVKASVASQVDKLIPGMTASDVRSQMVSVIDKEGLLRDGKWGLTLDCSLMHVTEGEKKKKAVDEDGDGHFHIGWQGSSRNKVLSLCIS